MSKNKLNSLQALRGLAALLVCFFHNRDSLIYHGKNYGYVFGEGHIGVSIFFTISGFIMIYTSQNLPPDRLQNVKSFLSKRFIRIIPLYYITTLIFIIMCHQGYYFNKDVGVLIKTFLFLPTGNPPPLYVGWTLNYEMFFYLIFGLCLFFGKKRLYILFSIYTILIIVLPYFIIIKPVDFTGETRTTESFLDAVLQTYTNPIQLLFVVGIFLGIILPKVKLAYHFNYLLLTIGTGLFLLAYLKLSHVSPYINVLIMGPLVLCFLLVDVSSKPLKVPKILIFLGDISYSLYLVHPLTIAYLPGIAAKLGLGIYTKTPVFFFMWLIITLACATVLYRLVEIKLTKVIKGKLFTIKASIN